jgi:hypothetical protein
MPPSSGASRARTTALASAPARHASAVSLRSDVASTALVTAPPRSLRRAAEKTSSRSGAPNSRPPATDTAWPIPLELIAIAGPVLAAPASSGNGASKVEARSRRAKVREAPPASCRNATQAYERSYSMSTSGESAEPPAGVASCGSADSVVP